MEEHLMLAAHMMNLEEDVGEEEVELQVIDRYGIDTVNFEALAADLHQAVPTPPVGPDPLRAGSVQPREPR